MPNSAAPPALRETVIPGAAGEALPGPPREALTRTKAARLADDLSHGGPLTVEAVFEATPARRDKPAPATTRRLFIQNGQRNERGIAGKGAPDETLAAEVSLSSDSALADFSVALSHFPMGGETWSYHGQTLVLADGKTPIPLVSGRSADTGGTARSIHLRAQHSQSLWLALGCDPLKKAGVIREIEAARGFAPAPAPAEAPRSSR